MLVRSQKTFRLNSLNISEHGSDAGDDSSDRANRQRATDHDAASFCAAAVFSGTSVCAGLAHRDCSIVDSVQYTQSVDTTLYYGRDKLGLAIPILTFCLEIRGNWPKSKG